MSNEPLTQVVRKIKMHVEWETTPVTNTDCVLIKLLSKSYEKELQYRKQRNHTLITFLILTNKTLKRPGWLLMTHFVEIKINVICLPSFNKTVLF